MSLYHYVRKKAIDKFISQAIPMCYASKQNYTNIFISVRGYPKPRADMHTQSYSPSLGIQLCRFFLFPKMLLLLVEVDSRDICFV